MPRHDRPLRIALLSYRSKPHCGGQGVYVRHLSRELVGLGHHVRVLSGQPYPELDPGVELEKVPSLDLYNDAHPFQAPPVRQWRDWIDALEVGTMWTAGFPEPLTFSLRVLRALRTRRDEFDVLHDNQTLGYGLLKLRARGFPLVTTIHHPITVDRRIEVEQAQGWQRLSKRRWYGFVGMQGRVARRVRPILVPSRSSAEDVAREFGVRRSDVHVVPLGVDTRVFRPGRAARVPGRVVCVASADSPLKGVATLLRAVAKLGTERDVSLTVVSRPTPDGPTDRLVDELSLRDRVTFVSGIEDAELARVLATAEVAVVPSLYEGFSLPAVEAMACGTPLVASRAGALPEVVGEDGAAGRLVTPGDPEELAAAVGALLDDAAERERMGAAAWRRVEERFTWRAVAAATADSYAAAIEAARPRAGGLGPRR
ncbi:glycosyltransferase family 4 protein [Marinitenerispora sediminis]|uniref:Glycosyl transferase family 1 n=1 Tax=Marinitenerispora sediminis TaxID=1931232 RepID=A0A368T894_9ACTN|nr:glycosyltransferase family 4 protein [Marinitenerispora sediminis]RCV47433.1 glycosyl transferase family 1 [Marinitenerispora sediminis]RCV51131.1 glycosyl transferase family 1 [Marinitenerispora sediminis]RCV60150.1 glycosyl transferase family 1 [Marinitenerispora sediminis]